MSYLSARHKWMISKVNETFNLAEDDKSVETFFGENGSVIDDWLAGKAANDSHVIFFHDLRSFDDKEEKMLAGSPELKVSVVSDPSFQGKVAYFLRQSDKPINLKFAQDATVSYGELTPGLLHLWKCTVESVRMTLWPAWPNKSPTSREKWSSSNLLTPTTSTQT